MGVSSFLYEKIGISQQALGAIIGAKQSTLSRHDNDT
jgi:DNA-binding MarR family transcriptional regulator